MYGIRWLVAHLEAVTIQVTELQRETDNATQFVELAEQYADITELDQDLIHRLIDRIEIGDSYNPSWPGLSGRRQGRLAVSSGPHQTVGLSSRHG